MSRIQTQARRYNLGISRQQTLCDDWESLTRQDQAHLVNINNIYAKTQRGEFPMGASVLPSYGEFDGITRYDEALDLIRDAQEAFMSLPADVRKKHGNDPAEWYRATLESSYNAHIDTLELEAKEAEAQAQTEALEAARKLVGANPQE